MKDTFAKFGLNMNLYNPGLAVGAGKEEQNSKRKESDNQTTNPKLQGLLEILPDYGFLLDTKLALPQTLFVE